MNEEYRELVKTQRELRAAMTDPKASPKDKAMLANALVRVIAKKRDIRCIADPAKTTSRTKTRPNPIDLSHPSFTDSPA